MFFNIFCLHKRECIFCFVEHVGILRGQWMVFVGCRHVFYKLQLKSDRCFWLTHAWAYVTSVGVFFVLNFVRVWINVLLVPHKIHTRTTWLHCLVMLISSTDSGYCETSWAKNLVQLTFVFSRILTFQYCSPMFVIYVCDLWQWRHGRPLFFLVILSPYKTACRNN